MPTTATYNNFFFLGTTPPTATTTLSLSGNSNTITDDQDSTLNSGTTNIGEQLSWTESTLTVTLHGITALGEPILHVSNGTYYVMSNTLTNGQQLGAFDDTVGATYTYCFAPGTLIAAPGREIAVEDLVIGDMILTAQGAKVPVTWIGRQKVTTMLAGSRGLPVCITAGALGDGKPHSDLTVTADHGMILDGNVINAAALVNGTTIRFVHGSELPHEVTYYHIETQDHDVILANGAEAETFVDVADRKRFDNYDEYLALYGTERVIPEMQLCRITSQRLLPQATRTRLGLAKDTPAQMPDFAA